MALKFKALERGEPGVAGGGTKKFYAAAVSDGEVDIDGLTERIEQISTVSGADIRAVLYALIDVIPNELDDGRIVRIGEVGSMRISISSNGEANAGAVNASSIKSARIIFTPGRKLKKMLKSLDYQKVSG